MSRIIKCHAHRRDDAWVAVIPKHGVYGHGHTLQALRNNLAQGLALIGVRADITLTPVSPELERLRSAEVTRLTALAKAVTTLTAQGATVNDIAAATGASTAQVTAIRAKNAASRTANSAGRTE